MMRPDSTPLTLADWRRRVAALYLAVREASDTDRAAVCHRFRAAKDELFRSHPDSPLPEPRVARFQGLAYYRYDLAWRVYGGLDLVTPRAVVTVDLGTEGTLRYSKVAVARFAGPAGPAALNLYWVEGYGGGLFLPFRDATSGSETFGGGRYLFDTIKGADLGASDRSLTLDFNYAYHPSCAYDARWSCPLAPPENTLPFPVRAGEKNPGTAMD